MNDLYQLIQSLTSSEWSALKIFLTAFSPHKPENNKLHKLTCILMEARECPGERYCIEKIYGNAKSTGFDMLKSRLKDKVLDFLLTDISTDKQKELDEMDLAFIRAHKLLAMYRQLLYSKRRLSIEIELLNEIILISKAYEFFSLLADALREKKTMITWKRNKHEFELVNKEINNSLIKHNLLNQAEHCYYQICNFHDTNANFNRRKELSLLKKYIIRIQKWYNETNSNRIKYYLNFLELDYADKNYSKGKKICIELFDLIKNNKSVYRKNRMGVIYDNLSRCDYYLKNYKDAIQYAQEARKMFVSNSENYCIALEQEFYATFALQQYERAEELAVKMLTSADEKELGKFRFAKYNFLHACALFNLTKFKETLGILVQPLEISKDKAGWEIGIRLLRIMCFIEMQRTGEAKTETERLRKFFKYNKKIISARGKKIIEFLLLLQKQNFSFSSTPSVEKCLHVLESKQEKYKWEPFTHEVIPFHQWFAEKMGKKRSYVPVKKEKVKVEK